MRPSLIAAAIALALPAVPLAQSPPASRAARAPAAISRPAPASAPTAPAGGISRPAPASAPAGTPAGTISRPGPAASPTAVPAPPRGAPGSPVVGIPAPPRGTVVVGPGGVVIAPVPLWWGWSWGYGYYPLYPHPLPPPGGAPPAEASRIWTKISAAGAISGDSDAGGVSLLVEGRRAGMYASFDRFDLSSGGALPSTSPALGLTTVNAVYAVASSGAFRVRLEVGGSALSIPSTGVYAGAPYAGTVAFGPDVGFSGQVGLVGPIGVEAHARFTPWPVPVTDVRSALALRAGPFALTGGWRAIQVSGDGTDGPEGWFDGPEFGVQARF